MVPFLRDQEAHKITQAIQVTTHLDNEDTKQREFDGLKEAMKIYQLKTGLILTDNTEFQQTGITVMPVWKWLLE